MPITTSSSISVNPLEFDFVVMVRSAFIVLVGVYINTVKFVGDIAAVPDVGARC